MPISSVPVVIGVGEFINRSTKPEDAKEPLDLILSAVNNAIGDSQTALKTQLLSSVDSIDVVLSWTWPYGDLPGLLARRLGIDAPKRAATSPHGGNQPAKVFDEAARRIARGEARVALLAGGEALASLASCAAKGILPPPGWTPVEKNVRSVFSPTTRALGADIGGAHSMGAPINIYPLYECGFRAARGQSMEENSRESAQLYANFAKIAAGQPSAWSYGKEPPTEEYIRTVSSKNRMICSPYPLLMNAFNNINLAAAVLVTSTEVARHLGIAESKWIYPLGGAGTQDASYFWERPNFYSSPSISKSLDASLAVSHLSKDQIDLFDFYSCFPIVPKLACHHLGLPISGGKPISLLGGLTSFGGAGNNYSMHAIIEMVRCLRAGRGQTGLVLANGGTLTYQHVVCLASKAPSFEYPAANPLPEHLDDKFATPAGEIREGEAYIETYSVQFNRDGTPDVGFIVCRFARNGDMSTEQVGKRGWIEKDAEDDGRNLFSFSIPADTKL